MKISFMLPAKSILESDIEVITTELALADLESLEKQMHKAQNRLKGGDKDAKTLMTVCEKLLLVLNQESQSGRSICPVTNSQHKNTKPTHNWPTLLCRTLQRMASIITLAWKKSVKLQLAKRRNPVLDLEGKPESEIAELHDDEKLSFLMSLSLLSGLRLQQ